MRPSPSSPLVVPSVAARARRAAPRVTPRRVAPALAAPLLVASALAACAPPPADAPEPSPAPAPASASPGAAPEGAAPAVSASGQPAGAPARRAPTSPAECVAMIGTEAARSDATVTPERGSGKSERFAGIVAALKRDRGALRCCYDLWAKDHPRDAGLTLAFAIDEAGAITGVKIQGDSGDPFALEAGGCIVDVALGIRYPPSPSGRTTTFEYDLGFKYHVAPASPGARRPEAPPAAAASPSRTPAPGSSR